MSRSVRLKKGFDIRIEGVAEKVIAGSVDSDFYGVKPIDFPGLIPKLNLKPGAVISAGTTIFHDKLRPAVKFCSPISGKVLSVERGERRKILEIVIEKNGEEHIDFGRADPSRLERKDIIERLLTAGVWPVIRQRPYHIVANPEDLPKSVFISGFDSSPLAPDYDFIMRNANASFLRTGISAVSKLTNGKTNLVLKGNGEREHVLGNVKGVEISYFSGPHPSGNVGVHIHHLDPLNKGEVVWFIGLQDILTIGRLFEEGIYKPEKIVALTGSEVSHPQYYNMISGSSIAPMVLNNLSSDNVRYISGNVLTGTKIKSDGYVGYYDSQVTVIPEGNYYEFFGWALPGIKKYSFSKTFLSSLLPKKNFKLDTNIHGGERAFVVTGEYEKVVPMDIYPMQLFKAILAEDIDMMENLGIYEVAEEDFALCEFICPSKIEIQSIVRKGLDLMNKEMS